MLAVRAMKNGMEIELTEPVASDIQLGIENFDVQQYYYVATDQYGGPKMGEEELNLVSVSLTDDRKKIFLNIEGIEERKVIYIHVKKPFKSQNDQALWSTEAWYTMTKKPQ